MRKQVLLSIIVPVYNTSEFLDRCIESVLTQTYENLEMILVNDGSTDGSEQILQKYAEIDDRIKIVNCEQNNGLFQARLRGYEQAKGQYICSLDSDDFVGRDYYRSMLQAAQESKAEIVISNMTTYYQKSGERFHRSLGNYAIRDIALNSQEEIRKAYFGMDAEISQWWFVWNKIYRREIWDRCYDILSQYTGHHIMLEDFVYGSVFMTNAKSVYSTEENNYFYVRHENASTGSGGGVKKLYKNINDIVDAFEFLDRYFEGKHYEKEGKEFVRKAAKRWKKTWGASVGKANIEDTDKKELKEILNRIRVPDEAKLDQFEDIWKGYFYRETTQYNPLREKIKNKILDNKTKVVCIQIPDVMCLDVLNDNQIEELLLANWEKTYKIQLGSILQMRRKYLEYFSEEGITHKSETNATEYFTDNLMSDDLKQLENELRTKYSYLNEALIDIYQFTINIGKPIAFVNTSHRKYSDFTERFGKENVFNAFDYQSDIFEIIVEKYLCEEDEVLYIGNGKKPTKRYLDEKHISFIKVEDKDEIFVKESLATLYKKNIFYNGILDVRKIVCCSNPFEPMAENSDYHSDPKRIGQAVLGPHVLSVSGWLINLARQSKRKTIVFLKNEMPLYVKGIYQILHAMQQTDIAVKEIDANAIDIFLNWIVFPDEFDESYACKQKITIKDIFDFLNNKKICSTTITTYLFEYGLKETDPFNSKQICKEIRVILKEKLNVYEKIKEYLQRKYKMLEMSILFGKQFSGIETDMILNYSNHILFAQLYPNEQRTIYQYTSYYNSKSVIDYPIRIYFEKELYSDSIVKYGERFLREEIRKGIVDFIHEYLCLFADCLEQILPYFSSMDSLEYDYFVSYPKSADRLLFDIVSMIDIEKKSKPRRLLSNIWWSKLDENKLLPEKKKKKAEEKNTSEKKHTYQMNPYATYYKCKEYQLDKFNSLERIMLYYIYDKDLLTYKLHKYAWSRHTLLPILHLFRKTEKKDRGCLYIATSNYNLLCCMIHKELYHKNDPCDLALSIWRKDKVSGLKAEKFFENIYIMDDNHFRNMTWQLDKEIEGKSKAETDYLVEGFYDRFYEELPVRLLRYRHIVATNTIMPITVLLQKLHLPYDCMEEAAGLYSDNSLLMNNMRGFHPKSEVYALDKYKMFDMNHVKGKRFVNLSAQTGNYSKKI